MILRVHFRRAIKETVPLNSMISFEIIIGGEFNEPIKTSLVLTDIEVLLLAGVLDNQSNSSVIKIIKFQATNESIYHISVNSPQSLGEYFLRVSINGRCDIISTISGRFNVVEFADLCVIRPLLHCFREIMLPTSISSVRRIYIQEEYGATLGSHLYDSSIVLLRYLSLVTTATVQSDGMVVELGAGCGLLGIFLALLLNPPCGLRILMTDKQYQLDLLRRNVHLNNVADRCSVAELDWESEAHLLSLRERVRLSAQEVGTAACVSTIIATDVLYDQSVVEAFCHIVKGLSTPGVTKMFLAQKMRGPDTLRADENDRILSVAKSIEAVHEEDSVIIWVVHM